MRFYYSGSAKAHRKKINIPSLSVVLIFIDVPKVKEQSHEIVRLPNRTICEKSKKIKNLTFELHILDLCILCSHKHNFKLSLFHFEQWLDIQ